MARSDKVPFRREFTLTSNGYVGNADGFFVGDILSLHIDIVDKSAGLLLEGKVGRQGNWELITSVNKVKSLPNIDIREYEYVRIQAFDIVSSTNVVIFGYEQNILQTALETVASERDFNTNIAIKCLLVEIKEELIKLNLQMAEITGDEI